MTLDIPANAKVVGTDGLVGRSICVILNPATRRLTHVVVKEADFPHTERLVPVNLVAESTPHQIRLRCSHEEFAQIERFPTVEFVQTEVPYENYDWEEYRLSPYVLPADEKLPAA